jgi:hypothetical protein
MTHSELVQVSEKWLKNQMRCSVVLSELVCNSATNEIPDAIGFNSYGSFMVECKTSYIDYLSDKKKPFRTIPENGMGNFRFILCPENVIQVNQIYSGWGLIWVVGKKLYPQNFKVTNIYREMGLTRFTPRLDCERSILVSAMRRLNQKIKEDEIPYQEN